MISPSGWEPLHRRMGPIGKLLRRMIAWGTASDPVALAAEREQARSLLQDSLVKVDQLDEVLSDPETMLWDVARNDPSEVLRDRALSCLPTFITSRSSQLIGDIVREILEATTTQQYVDRARAAAVLLTRLEGDGWQALFELASHPSDNVRRHVMGACREEQLPAPLAAAIALRGLEDPVPMVRQAAAGQCNERLLEADPELRNRLFAVGLGDTNEVQWGALLVIERLQFLTDEEEDQLLAMHLGQHHHQALKIIAARHQRDEEVTHLIEAGLHRHLGEWGPCFGYLLALQPIARHARHLAPLVSEIWISTAERHGPIYIYGPNEFAQLCLSILEAMLPDSLESIREGLESPATAGDAEEALRRIQQRPF